MKRHYLILFALLLLAAIATGCVTANAANKVETADTPEIVIKASDFSFEAPAKIEAGLVNITMENVGQEPHHVQMARINDGATLEQATNALQSDLGQFFSLVTFTGGPGLVDPGLSSNVTLDLQPGTYLLLCFMAGHDGVPHLAKGMMATTEVTEGRNNAVVVKPEADLSLTLKDFKIELPDEIKAGKQTWEVANEGPQAHEVMIVKLAEGKTLDDVLAFEQAPHGQPPFVNLTGFQAINPGQSGWLNLDLDPGNYAAVCHVPDPASGIAHEHLGMNKAFIVK